MANDYTVTIKHNQTEPLTVDEVRAANMEFNAPFYLRLSDKTILKADKVVRHIPGRRMVVFGEWDGQEVVAKLFLDRFRAAHQADKDVAGVKTLREHNIPTPTLLYQGADEGGGIQVLIFELIKYSDTLEEIWQRQEHPDDIWDALSTTIVELATQHVFGIVQRDLHLKNFLITPKIVYTLDGAQIELNEPILPKEQSIKNLAIFLSQLGVGHENLQERLYQHYAKSRGWIVTAEDIAQLHFHIKTINESRWHRYEKKIFRDCTNYKRIKTFTRSGMYDRAYANPEFMHFLKDPEAMFNEQAHYLKQGRSSTVIKAVLDGRQLVIKRFNMKDVKHRLRRTLRSTRAVESWRLANKLMLFGVATAKPVAYLENKVAGMRGVSYFVMQAVEGENIIDYFHRADYVSDESVVNVISNVIAVLKNLTKINVTHGDLKASNILIDEDHKPILIDLDGAAEHLSLSGLRRTWQKEIMRFLRNFDKMPRIQQIFKDELL